MKLPNAPLVEVVFELRWALEGSEDIPPPLRHDPLYPLFESDFTEEIRSHGFAFRRELNPGPPGPLGHSVQYRYSSGESMPFPLLQIGPGIFAYNESTGYEWASFRASLRKWIHVLLSKYPRTKTHRMHIVHMELRYVNAFGPELLYHTDLADFFSKNVKLEMVLNDFLKSSCFTGPVRGKLDIIRQIEGDKESSFAIEVGTGEASNKPTIAVTNKVVKKSSHIDFGTNVRSISSSILKWADFAHGFTHEFFLDFVGDNLMDEFRR